MRLIVLWCGGTRLGRLWGGRFFPADFFPADFFPADLADLAERVSGLL